MLLYGKHKMKKMYVKQHNNISSTKEYVLVQVPKIIEVMFYVVLLFFAITIIFITCFKIDDVVKVNGIVRTKENVSSVKNVIPGKITEIYYYPGKRVKKGEILYKIDSVSYVTQRENLILEKKDLEIKHNGHSELIRSFNLDKNVVSRSDEVYYSRFESFLQQKRLLGIRMSMAKANYEYEINNPEVIKNPRLIEQRKNEYDLSIAEHHSFTSKFISDISNEYANIYLQLQQITQSLNKLDNQYEYLEVKSPVDGYVQELSSLNIDDYLEENFSVLRVIPDDTKSYRVELQVPPKDIGKIREGLVLKYRLSAFPFFEYKGAEGVITSIDPDIRTNDNSILYYSIYGDINKIYFENREGIKFPIKAGLEASVRIVLDRNTIMYFILKKMDFLY